MAMTGAREGGGTVGSALGCWMRTVRCDISSFVCRFHVFVAFSVDSEMSMGAMLACGASKSCVTGTRRKME